MKQKSYNLTIVSIENIRIFITNVKFHCNKQLKLQFLLSSELKYFQGFYMPTMCSNNPAVSPALPGANIF